MDQAHKSLTRPRQVFSKLFRRRRERNAVPSSRHDAQLYRSTAESFCNAWGYDTVDRLKRPMVWESRWQELATSGGGYADRMADRVLDRRIFAPRSLAVAFQR